MIDNKQYQKAIFLLKKLIFLVKKIAFHSQKHSLF